MKSGIGTFNKVVSNAYQMLSMKEGGITGKGWLWGHLKDDGVRVELFRRHGHGEQQFPDIRLQLSMLHDTPDNDPGAVVPLTGDGLGYANDEGFYKNLEKEEVGGGIAVMEWFV